MGRAARGVRRAVLRPGHLSQREHVIQGPHLCWGQGQRHGVSVSQWWQVSLLGLTTGLSAGP